MKKVALLAAAIASSLNLSFAAAPISVSVTAQIDSTPPDVVLKFYNDMSESSVLNFPHYVDGIFAANYNFWNFKQGATLAGNLDSYTIKNAIEIAGLENDDITKLSSYSLSITGSDFPATEGTGDSLSQVSVSPAADSSYVKSGSSMPVDLYTGGVLLKNLSSVKNNTVISPIYNVTTSNPTDKIYIPMGICAFDSPENTQSNSGAYTGTITFSINPTWV